MEKQKNCRFPWLIALFLCLYIALSTVAVTRLGHDAAEPAPSVPTQTTLAQPDHQGGFAQLFAQPDWAQLYARAGLRDTEFEGAAAFAAHMQDRVGDKTLTYYEVRTDLADTHRYLVFLEDEKIAAFTMRGEGTQIAGLELFYEPAVSVTVETPVGYTALVNGVALDERFTVRTMETKAEKYLPEGVHGLRRQWQTVTGLLAEPQVTARDENGQPVQLQKDAKTGIYRIAEKNAPEITAQQAELARKAAIADAMYAIGAISNAQLGEYFDKNAPLYKMLITNPRNLQKYTSACVDESTMTVGEYCRYSDTLYSVNVKLTQKIIRTTGTLKVYTADKTYFFTEIDGVYRVTAYTNEHVTQPLEQVRLSFVTDGDTVRQLVCTTDAAVAAPEVMAPQGQKLVGWATKAVDGNQITMTIRVLPDGTVLGDLEPMELYPVFE